MSILVYTCLGGFGVFGMAALFLWGIWVHRYVELHRERPAFFLFNWASLIDYRKAHRIAKRDGYKPWFLVWYERLQITALCFFILGVVFLIIWSIKEP